MLNIIKFVVNPLIIIIVIIKLGIYYFNLQDGGAATEVSFCEKAFIYQY